MFESIYDFFKPYIKNFNEIVGTNTSLQVIPNSCRMDSDFILKLIEIVKNYQETKTSNIYILIFHRILLFSNQMVYFQLKI